MQDETDTPATLPETPAAVAAEKVAVVMLQYGDIRHVSPEERDDLLAAGTARLATAQDLAIGG